MMMKWTIWTDDAPRVAKLWDEVALTTRTTRVVPARKEIAVIAAKRQRISLSVPMDPPMVSAGVWHLMKNVCGNKKYSKSLHIHDEPSYRKHKQLTPNQHRTCI